MTTLKITGTGATLALALTMTAPAMADTFAFRVGSGHPVAGLSHMQALDEFYLPEVARRVEERTDHKVRWVKEKYRAGHWAWREQPGCGADSPDRRCWTAPQTMSRNCRGCPPRAPALDCGCPAVN